MSGVQVPGSEGGIGSGSFWDDIWSGAGSVFDQGLDAIERWYELQAKREIAQLNFGALATPSYPTASAPAPVYNPGPFENISSSTILMVAGVAVLAVVVLRK